MNMAMLDKIKKMAVLYSQRTGCSYDRAVVKAWSYLSGQELTVKEIAYVLNITKLNVSQATSTAMRKLKSKGFSVDLLIFHEDGNNEQREE